MSHTNMAKMVKYAKKISDPQDEDNDYQSVQDRFDLPLHRNKPVDEPQHKPYSNNCDDDGGKRHSIFSNHFSDSIRAIDVVGKFQAIYSDRATVMRKRRVILRFIPILPVERRNS